MFFKRKKYRTLNKALRVLLISNGLILVAGAMLGPIYALFIDDVGGSLLDAGFMGAIFALAAGITTLIVGKKADASKNPKQFVIIGFSLMGIGFLLYTLVGSLWQLFFVQILIGIGEAIYSPAYDGLFSQHIDKHHESSEWSMWESMYYFTTAIGAAIGGYIATVYSFNILFMLMSAICFGSVLYLIQIPKKVL